MTKKDKNISESNDKTYVRKPEIHYSYKFQPYIRDLGGSPGKNMTQEDRNKKLQHENNVNAVRNVARGLNNTFGTAISGASLFYGGGWALNRLLHLNKASNLGQFFGRYALPANTADNISDGVELIFNPSVEGAVDLGTGVVLGRFKDLSNPVRQVGELVGLGANINNMKDGGKMNILEFLKNGSGIHIKKKNRGKFTSYCGGKVTDECILKGKNSSNPAIRKRATFADNARHFKHRSGGKAFVKGVNVLDSNQNAYKLVKKKVKMRLWGGDITINSSPDIMRHYYWRDFVQEYADRKKLEKALLDTIDALLKILLANSFTNNLTNLAGMLIEGIGNKKKSTNVTPSTTVGTSSYFSNIGNNGWLSANLNSIDFFTKK